MIKRLLQGLVLAYLIFLVGGNWFINSSTLAGLIDSWDDGIATYRWGVTPFPGVVWIKGLSFWHQDKNVLWTTQADDAYVVAWLPSLLRKKLHFTMIRIPEAKFHFIQKKKLKNPAKVKQNLYASLTFPRAARPKKPPGKTEDKWGIIMTGVNIVSLQDAWVDEYRYKGSAQVRGGFSIDPDRKVTVGPASVVFSPGNFLLGEKVMGEDLKGRIDYVITGFHPDAPDPDIFHAMTSDIDITLKTKTLSPANLYLTSIDWIRFGEGSGPISLRVALNKGVITAPTRIEYQTPEITVALGKFNAYSAAKILWGVKDSKAKLDADLLGVSITAPNDKIKIVDQGRLGLTATTKDLDIAENLFEEIDLGFKLAKARVPSLVSLNRFFPKGSPFRFKSGSAELNTQLQATRKQEEGTLDFATKDASISYGERDVRTKLTLNVPFENKSGHRGRFKVTNARLKLTDLVFLSDPDRSESDIWWGEFELPNATVVSQPHINVDGAFKLRMADTAPVIKMLRPDHKGEDIVTRLLTSNEVTSSGKFSVGESGFDVDDVKLDSDSLVIKGFYKEQNALTSARILVAREPFAVGVELKGGNRRIILQDAFGWYAKASAE